MKYDMTSPCDQCPFLKSMARGFTVRRLREFAANEFPCHKTATEEENEDGQTEFAAARNSQHCAGALIFLEKRGQPHQMMRICERLGLYDARRLNIQASVR